MAMLTKLLQQRDLSIYVISAATVAGMLIWRKLPDGWVNFRRMIILWLVAVEWSLLNVR
jgi:hypothetical protein